MNTDLTLPDRAAKPRSTGVTMMIDNGLPMGAFTDIVASNGELVDLVKFGWGTAVVTARLPEKLACLRAAGIGYFFGGTLFEKHVAQGRFDSYRRLCHEHGCRHVEVSNGTMPIAESRKAEYVAKLAQEFTVLSEVGSKTVEGNELLRPKDWARQVRTDLAHGARWVITEARESGTTGIAGGDGRARLDVLDAIQAAGVDPDLLMFEAPTKALQSHFVLRFGADVNLGNIAPADLIGLETLRLGLRSDTMLDELGPDDELAADDATRDRTGSPVRSRKDAFHLAIPAHDLDEAYSFYVEGLGCKLARRYADRLTLDFFGDQVVCHLHDMAVPAGGDQGLYPRHFGVTFRDRADLERLLQLCRVRKLPLFREPALRFEGMVEEHTTVVLRDPSGNLLEFKHYVDPRMMH